ncbi:PREDICTED: putative F-box protein At3g23420 [Camelina sativa]|uniref:F-box protein At3g23420 n=1 Tax=Camelina sativa TaxID=90675 RepID=A0ABM0WAR7_CAMSA|nr:PREDICTED: putative F-box protein At3g23420 [Camelina sativa]
MSDLPRDLAEEVLSRVPLTSLRAVRTTCKNWNGLFKHQSLTKKHIRNKSRAATKLREFMAIMMMDSSVYLMSVGIHNEEDYNVESFISRKGKLISVNDADGVVHISSVFHCSGLLLCLTKEETPRLVVWNPFRGQTRWIETTYREDITSARYSFALGYEKKENSHRSLKILRSSESTRRRYFARGYREESRSKFEIYNFNSDSWKDITPTANGNLRYYKCGVSLKGNTYWLARTHIPLSGCRCCAERRQAIQVYFLLCFDFTTERFGPELSLPFRSSDDEDTVTLSSVREEKLAVLFQRKGTSKMEIWITTKVEPEAASWSNLFLSVDMTTLVTSDRFSLQHDSFFLDEEKKVFMLFANGKAKPTRRKVAYIIGEDGYFKKVDLGEYTDKYDFPLVCSYVPSSMQIKQAAPPQGNHIDSLVH